MPVTARFFSPIQDLEDRTILKNTSKRECFRREHYGARYLKGFKTATSKCAKSRSFRVAMVRP